MRFQFRNDYDVLAHPRILQALERYSNEQNVAYGLDYHSINAKKYISDVFELKNDDIHFLSGGTQTNLILISAALRHYEAVISHVDGHINVHESGAIEGNGYKIITTCGKDGKVYPEDIVNIMNHYKEDYMVKPRMVYISNSTECGTIYSKEELINLHHTCMQYSLYLFIDGARLGSALTSEYNDVDPSLLAKICDAFYIGGTKNGLLFGEALVIVNQEIKKDFRYILKNKGAMLAKGYALGIQFEEAFKDNLYFELARSTNKVAKYLKDKLLELGLLDGVSPTNQVFIKIKNPLARLIIEQFGSELWVEGKESSIIRLVVSFKTTEADVDELINFIKVQL